MYRNRFPALSLLSLLCLWLTWVGGCRHEPFTALLSVPEPTLQAAHGPITVTPQGQEPLALPPTGSVSAADAEATPAMPTATPLPFLQRQEAPAVGRFPTLADLWAGQAGFTLEVADTGLPMGESDTIVMRNGELWSYLHASQRSAGTIDRCGDPVDFPGCAVIYRSLDGGLSFSADPQPLCQVACLRCPCRSTVDHVDQQQYPQVAFDGLVLHMAYEYRARVMVRRSVDGLHWSTPEELPGSGIWHYHYRGCLQAARIGSHPFVPPDYNCLLGGPPGIFVEEGLLTLFVAMGQNPSSMGCYQGRADFSVSDFEPCRHNPLFTGATTYGPLHASGAPANPYFDFRTISSAEVQKIGSHYYMLYEGVRGPGPGDPGDSQFGLGLARSLTSQIDGPWETYPGNPTLVDLPGNIGLGHSDLLVLDGQTLLYTSLDGSTRSRLLLTWH